MKPSIVASGIATKPPRRGNPAPAVLAIGLTAIDGHQSDSPVLPPRWRVARPANQGLPSFMLLKWHRQASNRDAIARNSPFFFGCP
ncbi:MAG: hypothetical protein WCO00_17685 [Rhodospirillaceae bacterium]